MFKTQAQGSLKQNGTHLMGNIEAQLSLQGCLALCLPCQIIR